MFIRQRSMASNSLSQLRILARNLLNLQLQRLFLILNISHRTFQRSQLHIMRLHSRSVLFRQLRMIKLDLIQLLLRIRLLSLQHIQCLHEFLLPIRSLLLPSNMLVYLCLQVPVLIFISVLTLIERAETGGEVLALRKQGTLFDLSTFQSLFLLRKSLL